MSTAGDIRVGQTWRHHSTGDYTVIGPADAPTRWLVRRESDGRELRVSAYYLYANGTLQERAS